MTNPYHFTDEQLDTVQVDQHGRGHMLIGFFLEPLNPLGEAALRKLWDADPHSRRSFAVEPPEEWRLP